MENLPADYFFTRNVYQDVYPSIDPSSPSLSLAGKVVIITGASRGIGAKGIAPSFAHAGAKAIILVATNAIKLAEVEATLHEINPAVQTLSVATDISSASSVASLFETVNAKFGHADILTNNAGVNAGGGNIHEEDPDAWWRNFEINTKGAFLLSQSFLKSLPSPTTHATIVNLVTAGAWYVHPNMSGYTISKLAALELTAHIAAAYPNVTAVALHPGLVETDMLMDLSGERAKFLSGRVVAANWSVDGLVEKKGEIEEGNLLRVDLVGRLGREQFE
ncbi:hypothetical protein OQA88_10703 [Cercophora sp. LCS_1]